MLVLCLSFSVAFIDQLTKFLIRRHFTVGDEMVLIPDVFSLSYVQNPGAAWGMLAGLGGWLVAVSVIMLVVMIFFRHSFMTDALVDRVAAGLMIAGIVGNLIDRIRLGYVVDFLRVHWFDFPAFNVADASICVGVGLYILVQALDEWSRRRAQNAETDGPDVDAPLPPAVP